MKKKYFLALLIALFISTTVEAQIFGANNNTVIKIKGEPKTSICMDFGTGYAFTSEDPGVGLDLGFRVTHMFNKHWGWDIIKVSGQACTGYKHFESALGVYGSTGVRYVSSPSSTNKTLYVNLGVGGGYIFDTESGTPMAELGVGVNLTKSFSTGLFCNARFCSVDNYSSGGYYKGESEEWPVVVGAHISVKF